jgi:hypothetical protein
VLWARQIQHQALEDMILFLVPVVADLSLASSIFGIFEGALGLACNMSKCHLALIRCDESHLNLAMNYFPCAVVEFLVCYLGIPLSVTKLPRSSW